MTYIDPLHIHLLILVFKQSDWSAQSWPNLPHCPESCNSVCQSVGFYKSGLLIGQFSHDGIGCKTSVKFDNTHCSVPVSFDPSVY